MFCYFDPFEDISISVFVLRLVNSIFSLEWEKPLRWFVCSSSSLSLLLILLRIYNLKKPLRLFSAFISSFCWDTKDSVPINCFVTNLFLIDTFCLLQNGAFHNRVARIFYWNESLTSHSRKLPFYATVKNAPKVCGLLVYQTLSRAPWYTQLYLLPAG